MPTRNSIRAWESYLTSVGGERHRARRAPDQLQVWRPENAGGWDAFDSHWWEYCEALSTCLKRTVRGDRAFLYESGEGITALVDFQGETFWHDHWGYVAPALFRPIAACVRRTDMARSPALGSILRRGPVNGQNLAEEQAAAISALIPGGVPPFIAMPQRRCRKRDSEWLRADREWGRELPMRDAVLRTREWRKLFRQRPRPEVRSADGADR